MPDDINYGRFLERLENMEHQMLEMKADQKSFLDQGRQVFNYVGDRERLGLLSMKLGIVKDVATLGLWTILVILYVVKHPF